MQPAMVPVHALLLQFPSAAIAQIWKQQHLNRLSDVCGLIPLQIDPKQVNNILIIPVMSQAQTNNGPFHASALPDESQVEAKRFIPDRNHIQAAKALETRWGKKRKIRLE